MGFPTLSALYSSQAIEIYPGQRSNIGIANLRARWEQFAGIKFETNSLGPIAIEGLGRRAVAWGIGNTNLVFFLTLYPLTYLITILCIND